MVKYDGMINVERDGGMFMVERHDGMFMVDYNGEIVEYVEYAVLIKDEGPCYQGSENHYGLQKLQLDLPLADGILSDGVD